MKIKNMVNHRLRLPNGIVGLGLAQPRASFQMNDVRRDLNQDHPRSGKDLGVEICFGEWMMAFGFAEFVIASLLFEYV